MIHFWMLAYADCIRIFAYRTILLGDFRELSKVLIDFTTIGLLNTHTFLCKNSVMIRNHKYMGHLISLEKFIGIEIGLNC